MRENEREKTNAEKAVVGNAFKPDIYLQLNTRSICEYILKRKTFIFAHAYRHENYSLYSIVLMSKHELSSVCCFFAEKR